MIAVTGGSGRLGRAVLTELRCHGYQTTNLDPTSDGGLSDHYVRGDILDGERVASWLKGADALIHLAAIPAPGISSADWLTQVNVLGTVRVLAAAAAAGIAHVVLASSTSALGLAWGRLFRPHYLPIDEAHPLWPEDEYGVSKQVNELYGQAFARRYGQSIVILRFPTIVDAKMVPGFVAHLRQNPEHAARLLWSYVDVADAARACRLAITATNRDARAYYITASDHLAGSQLEQGLHAYFPTVPHTPAFRWDGSLISSSAAQAALGYVAEHGWGKQDIGGIGESQDFQA